MASSRNWPSSPFASLPPAAPVCVGFSGGLDSRVLLELAHASGRDVRAVHVHHGLSPNADSWARFCEETCTALGIPLSVERVQVDRDSGEGLEAAARTARYAVYARRAEPFVALGHHLDDQAETVLLQLLRGTGLKGVAAMPEQRPLPGSDVTLYRPLLAIPRAELRAYAAERGLRWIEDESNTSAAHDRNRLRHDVAPVLDASFPGWRQSVARFARHAGTAGDLLVEAAGVSGDFLVLDPSHDAAHRANALRAFLALNGLAMPSEARLAEMGRQLYEARRDARVRIGHDGAWLVRRRGELHIDRAPAGGDERWRIAWRGEADVDLGDGRGSVHFEPARGAGLAASLSASGDWCFMPRAGGETIRLDARRPTRTLKNLLQEHGVPEWQRQKLPLLFRDGELAWVPGVGIAAGFACPDAEPGFLPCWRVAGKAALC